MLTIDQVVDAIRRLPEDGVNADNITTTPDDMGDGTYTFGPCCAVGQVLALAGVDLEPIGRAEWFDDDDGLLGDAKSLAVPALRAQHLLDADTATTGLLGEVQHWADMRCGSKVDPGMYVWQMPSQPTWGEAVVLALITLRCVPVVGRVSNGARGF